LLEKAVFPAGEALSKRSCQNKPGQGRKNHIALAPMFAQYHPMPARALLMMLNAVSGHQARRLIFHLALLEH